MVSVLSGRNLILELSLKVDEKKTSFFRGGRRTTRKKLVFLRRPKVESSKVRFGPERTDTILLRKITTLSWPRKKLVTRAVASLAVPGGQEFHFPHFFLKFQSTFLIFPQTLLIFLPHFGPPGGRVAHPGRPWLRHCLSLT